MTRPPTPIIDCSFIQPMECLSVSKLPEGPQWVYEVKFDGFRAQAINGSSGLQLLSRNGLDLSMRAPGIARELADSIPIGCIIDGELCALDPNGRPSFGLMQNARTNDAPLVFYAFDILMHTGTDVTHTTLAHRRELLQATIKPTLAVQVSDFFAVPAERMLALVQEHALEGVVAKRLDSRYEPGGQKRSGAWVKLRVNLAQEFVIGGFTPGGHGFDAVIIGFYRGDKLMYAGRVRNGFVPMTRRALAAKLDPLVTDTCPFANLPEKSAGPWGQGLTAAKMLDCEWIQPNLVAQFAFLEWTSAEHLRHVKYIGLREDKRAIDVIKEVPAE